MDVVQTLLQVFAFILQLIRFILVIISLPNVEQLQITPKTMHFSNEEEVRTFEVIHRGWTDTKIAVTITPSKPWLEVTPNEVMLGKNDKVTVQVYLNRQYSHTEKSYPDFATAKVNINSFFERHSLRVTTAPDYYTEIFDKNIDLPYKSLSFVPDNSINFYKLTVKDISDFRTKPEVQNPITYLPLQYTYKLTLADNKKILFYGQSYDTLYISCFGWIEFENLSTSNTKSGNKPTPLEQHFYAPRISLFPINNINNAGTISFAQLQNRLVITYENVPTYQNELSDVRNTFQIEFYFTGRIDINYLAVDKNASGIIGLSYGTGEFKEPSSFLPSDLVP